MSTRTLITVRGEALLQADLEEKKKKLNQISQAIGEAAQLGDLKENAEYHSAKNEQKLLLRDIQNIISKLQTSQIIDPSKLPKSGKVVFGSTVHLVDTVNQKKMVWQIVGEDEADFKSGTISLDSPMARALIGKKSQDTVEIKTLEGTKLFKVEKVEYI